LNPFCSVFSQLLKLFPRSEFDEAVRVTKAERHARGFTCWEQLTAMMFCHLGGAQSLTEICHGLASVEGKLNHLGIEGAPKKSTLAYANVHRPAELYELLFQQMYRRCQQHAPKHRLKFKNPLLSIDATVIELCASMFDWARYKKTKGAVKLHMVLDHSGLLPSFCRIEEARKYDVVVARELEFAPGTVVVFDRGYTDYNWYRSLTEQHVVFVTRLKRRALYEVVEERPIPQRSRVIRDVIVRLTSRRLKGPAPLFRIVEFRAADGRIYEFFTNQLTFGATTIAAIYEQRWEIESFFKALKQNLKIKTFVGISANALKIQIWTALIAMLILRYLKLRSTFGWALSNLVAMLRFNLFTHRDLWSWLDNPFDPPPRPPDLQLALAWTASEGG
jgi:hypothetical protein